MSRPIHGQSTKALRFLREKPAALAVYWCYVARMNNEGVSWPSARGLAKDTGWNKSTCLEARQLLVTLCALETVPDYVRPEWRKMPEGEQKKKSGLDRSEYFRPTGYLLVENQKFMLLYNGGDDANDIDAKAPDVRRGRPSMPQDDDTVGRLSGGTELDSSSEHDSSKSELDTTPIAPDGAVGASSPSSPFIQSIEPDAPVFSKERVFDCIAWAVFHIKDMRDLKKPIIVKGKEKENPAGARIGIIANWVKKFYPGMDEKFIAEKVVAFYRAWSKRRNYSIPRDANKFAEEWIAWDQEKLPAPKLDGQPKTTYEPGNMPTERPVK